MGVRLFFAGPIIAAILCIAACSGGQRAPVRPSPSSAQPFAVPTAQPNVREACDAKPRAGYAKCFMLIRTDVTNAEPQIVARPALVRRSLYQLYTTSPSLPTPTPSHNGYGPAQLQIAYNVRPGTGSRLVGIVDAFDDPNAELDLAKYRDYYGLPPCTTANQCFTKLDQRGGKRYPRLDEGWASEIALDLDMVSAICPTCKIVLVEADDNQFASLDRAVETAASSGSFVISNSYGGQEQHASDAAYDSSKSIIVASAGDNGFGVSEPAAFKNVVSVGGTSLIYDVVTGFKEVAWSSSGGGCSSFVVKPVWQKDPACKSRIDNDISAVANPDTGVAVYSSYDKGWIVVGGTSASAPIIAAMFALSGSATPLTAARRIWEDAGAHMNTISGGSNGDCSPPMPAYYCEVVPGYNAVTGWGSPHGTAAL